MPLADALLPEFDHETGVTRRLLERLPDGQFAWTRTRSRCRSANSPPTWPRC